MPISIQNRRPTQTPPSSPQPPPHLWEDLPPDTSVALAREERGLQLWLLPKAGHPALGGLEPPKHVGPKHSIDPKYKPYLDQFIELAKEHGVDLASLYDAKITIKDMPKSRRTRGRVAEAFLRDKKGLFVYVDPTRFWDGKRSEHGRAYVMYHEFGHDVLNFPHSKSSGVVGIPGWELTGPMLMRPSAYSSFFSGARSDEVQQRFVQEAMEDVFSFVKSGKGTGLEKVIRRNTQKYSLEQVVKIRAQYGTPYTPQEIEAIRARYYGDTAPQGELQIIVSPNLVGPDPEKGDLID